MKNGLSSKMIYLASFASGFMLARVNPEWKYLFVVLIEIIILWWIFALIRAVMKKYNIGSKGMQKFEHIKSKLENYGNKTK